MYQFETLPPAERLAQILDSLFQTITRPAMPGFRVIPIAAPLFSLIWSRLCRIRTRFRRALATPYIPRRRKAAPAVPEIVIARSAAPRQSSLPSRPASLPPPHAIPRQLGWLMHLIQETGSIGSQLRHCLNQPDAIALIEHDPRLARLLRPLCRALHVFPHHVPCLYPPKPPKASPYAPGPAPAAPPVSSEAPPQAAPAPPAPVLPHAARPEPFALPAVFQILA